MKNSIINSADEDKMWWKLPDHIDNLLKQYNEFVISNEQIKNFVSIEERIKAISELHTQCNNITTDARNLLGISSLSLTESSNSGDEHTIENYFPVDIVEYLVDLIKSTSVNELNLLDNTSELNHTRRIYCLLERYFRIQHFTTDCNVAFNVNHPVEGTLRPDLIGQFMKKTFLLEEDKPEKCDTF
ncbi:MAG: hypothetical protein Q7U68_04885, partial [Candidatus Roizmanbacteria bacterium]|nr:hypothetical protein [Candidatus Roizmanbacteria bacterium]